MNRFKLSALVLLAAFFSMTLFAQTSNSQEDNLSLNSGSIDNQFEFVIKRSNRYQEYKVVRTTWLLTLKAHTLDSLKAIQDQLDGTKKGLVSFTPPKTGHLRPWNTWFTCRYHLSPAIFPWPRFRFQMTSVSKKSQYLIYPPTGEITPRCWRTCSSICSR